MQHPKPLHPLHPRNHIRDRVVPHMTHVEIPRWVGKHGQSIELGLRKVYRSCIQSLSLPSILPLGFDRCGIIKMGFRRGFHGFTEKGDRLRVYCGIRRAAIVE